MDNSSRCWFVLAEDIIGVGSGVLLPVLEEASCFEGLVHWEEAAIVEEMEEDEEMSSHKKNRAQVCKLG